MARQRITATELAKMLNSAAQPIYVLDDEWIVVFCNRALHEWLGPPAEELPGQRCTYHSQTDVSGPQSAAAGLCPPPAAMAGRKTTASVSSVTGDDRVRYRRATFVPLGSSAEDQIGVLAILQTEDLSQAELPPAPSGEAETIAMHEHIRQFRHQAAGRYRADRLLGDSPAMRRARTQIELAVVGRRSSVLLVGPPGSGRRHVAAAIHYGGHGDSSGSLIPLACSVLGVELIHSTVTALATGGPSARDTLLLNRADRLPAEVQGELAAILAQKSFPLRLIATAEEPLVHLARQGRYHPDLAAVLSTISIELPPLAERREDLPLLAQLFIEGANVRGTRQHGGFTPEALDALDAYSWPGNLDELAQVVAESHQQAEGPEVDVGDLPERIHLAADAAAHPPRKEETVVLDEFLDRVERELIDRAMTQAKGNKAKAARMLGMSRPRLYRRLVQLGLEKENDR